MSIINNDITLLEQLRSGSRDAFDYLYVTYRHWLIVVALRILNDEKDAEDVVQDFFIDLWTKRLFKKITATDERALKGFLYVSINNRSCTKLATRQRAQQRIDSMLQEVVKEALPDLAEKKIDFMELRHLIISALCQLPPMPAKVARLAYLEEKNRKEIANELNLSENTVKNHLHTGTKILRAHLKKISAH